MSIRTILLATIFYTALAAPSLDRHETACGRTHYSASAVAAAVREGYRHYKAGDEAGHSDYPHAYKDYERFKFHGVPGPFQEFPIMPDGRVYDGGKPGSDRVVFNTKGRLAGVITHRGAKGDDFLGCSGTDSYGGSESGLYHVTGP